MKVWSGGFTPDVSADVGDFWIGSDGTLKVCTFKNPNGAPFFASLGSQGAGLSRTPLDQSTWTSTNLGGATVTQANGVVRMFAGSAGGENLRIRSGPAPVTPFTIRAGLMPNPMYHLDFQLGGVCLRESSTGKVVSLFFQTQGLLRQTFSFRKNTNATTLSSSGASNILGWSGTPIYMWMQDAGPGGNITLSYGFDGLLPNAVALLNEPRGTFFTVGPDQVGIVIMNFGSGDNMGVSYVSWDITNP